jgi:hypothetical protein
VQRLRPSDDRGCDSPMRVSGTTQPWRGPAVAPRSASVGNPYGRSHAMGALSRQTYCSMKAPASRRCVKPPHRSYLWHSAWHLAGLSKSAPVIGVALVLIAS